MEDAIVEDEADARARQAAALAEYEAMQMRKRSRAVQLDLPRPTEMVVVEPLAGDAMSKLVNNEATDLLAHDVAKYSKNTRPAVSIEEFDESLMTNARELIEAEAQEMLREQNSSREDFADAFIAALVEERKKNIFVPSLNSNISVDEATEEQRLEAAKACFESLRRDMEKDAKRASKLEQKCNLLTAGLQKRDGELRQKLKKTVDEIQSLAIEAESFAMLHEQEQRAAPERIEYWLELVQAARAREKLLQEKYSQLTRELNAR